MITDIAKSPNTQEDAEKTPEEAFYGEFRSIVKQRFFGLKLEEEPFMEFIESNSEMRQGLDKTILLMGTIKGNYMEFLKKNYPHKVEKRKKKRKNKRKSQDLPKDEDANESNATGTLSDVTWEEALMFFSHTPRRPSNTHSFDGDYSSGTH